MHYESIANTQHLAKLNVYICKENKEAIPIETLSPSKTLKNLCKVNVLEN